MSQCSSDPTDPVSECSSELQNALIDTLHPSDINRVLRAFMRVNSQQPLPSAAAAALIGPTAAAPLPPQSLCSASDPTMYYYVQPVAARNRPPPSSFALASSLAVPKAAHSVHRSLLKPEHKQSKAARRGPMDEMRQLVRILLQVLPQSANIMSGILGAGANEDSNESARGNRVTEDQIKDYMRYALGTECPQPEWGLPQGWGLFMAGARRVSRVVSL